VTSEQLQELRARMASQRSRDDLPRGRGWNAALDWIEQQIIEIIGDTPFKLGDGPVSMGEFEKVVGGG
jgi:hypothetical protein